ncbi:hypothetical protein C8Q74DRAFT_228422 [Fomes fomentarius]|nr:hypothetical protein C8Q74DRAFT_228422 [Fomes fomentarius]
MALTACRGPFRLLAIVTLLPFRGDWVYCSPQAPETYMIMQLVHGYERFRAGGIAFSFDCVNSLASATWGRIMGCELARKLPVS